MPLLIHRLMAAFPVILALAAWTAANATERPDPANSYRVVFR